MDATTRSPLDVVTALIDELVTELLSGNDPDHIAFQLRSTQLLAEHGWDDDAYDRAICDRIDSMGDADANLELTSEDRP